MFTGETVTRVRREAGGVDRYGNPTYTTMSEDVPGALVADGRFAEPAEVGRDRVEADVTLYWLNAEVDGVASDRWVVRGVMYDAVGDAFFWSPGAGASVTGTVVRLRRVEG